MDTLLQYSPLNTENGQFFASPCTTIEALECVNPDQKLQQFSITFDDGLPLNSTEVDHIQTTQQLIDYLKGVEDLDLVEATIEYEDGLAISNYRNEESTFQYKKDKINQIAKTFLEHRNLNPDVLKEIKKEPWKYIEFRSNSEIRTIYDTYNDYMNG